LSGKFQNKKTQNNRSSHDIRFSTSINFISLLIQHISPKKMTEKIKQIKSGYRHTLILTRTGKVYELGDINSCELGEYYDVEANIHKTKPCLIDPKYFEHGKIVQITAGAYHSMALSQKGDVYVWGL